MASRTDRGVHARGNALALNSPLDPGPLLRAINGVAPDLFFTRLRQVPERFNPRAAVSRSYRYFEPSEGRFPDRWRELLEGFVGPVDVRSFGRGVPSAAPVFREVEAASLRVEGPLLVVELRARSFVWGMVRKIVAAVRAAASGELEESALRDAIAGRRRVTLPLAEPERLVLWSVDFDEPFDDGLERVSRRQSRRGRESLEAALVRAAVVRVLTAEVASAPGG